MKVPNIENENKLRQTIVVRYLKTAPIPPPTNIKKMLK